MRAAFHGEPGEPEAILARMNAIRAEREAAQPLRVATGGSTFKNPPGHKAWQLIDAAGCRGLRLGAAMVSEKHCNFLINTGGASADEVERLGELVRQRVREHSGVDAGVGGHPHRPARQPGAGRMTRHVAVLMGGLSAEREVSLVSGEACAKALEEQGYPVTRIDVGRDLHEVLARTRPDVVFNALHGRFGEDGRVQGVLDQLGLPYTHSGVLASALAMDKPMAKRVFASAGLRCPEGVETTLEQLLADPPLAPPFVVKPAAEGSSVGVVIVLDHDLRPLTDRNDVDPDCRLLVERYVAGRELTCAVLGDEPLAVTEIRPNDGFYDYRAKYTEGFASHLVPAPLSPDLYDEVMESALRAHRVLGCRGVSRADFRLDPSQGDGGLYLLEVNTQPGMTPLSLVPEQAAYRGIGFGELVVRLLEHARCDT